MPTDTISWEGLEHQHVEQTRDWYIALGVIALSCALTSILFKNVLFALLICVAALTIGIVAARPPRHVVFQFTEDGLTIDDEKYPFKDMRAFWVSEKPTKTLFIDTPRMFAPDVVIPLPDNVDAATIRALLQELGVEEREMQESFAYRTFEFFGF